jgi:hypothetical protein
MQARAIKETLMPEDSNFVKLESTVQHIQSDVTELKGDVKLLWTAVEALRAEFLSFKADVAREFGAIRASMERDFGAMKASMERDFGAVKSSMERDFGAMKAYMERELGSARTAMERELGSIRTSIERAKLWMVVTGVATILSVWGAALALARFLKP